MRDDLEQRAKELALYMIENRTTVRAAAKKFGVSKSTVQGPVRASGPVRPGAVHTGKGHTGRKPFPAAHPRRNGHAPQV